MIIFIFQFSFFREKTVEKLICDILGTSVSNSHIFLRLEDKIRRAGHLLNTAALHHNDAFLHILPSSKMQLLNIVFLVIFQLIVQL